MWSLTRLCSVGRAPISGVLSSLTKNSSNFNISFCKREESSQTALAPPDNENAAVANVLKKTPGYASTVFFPDNIQAQLEADKALFHPVALEFWNNSLQPDLKPLEDEIYSELISNVVKNVASLSDSSIKVVLAAMMKYPWGTYPKHPNFQKLWKAVDAECYKRIKNGQWDFDLMFQVDDAFCRQGLQRFTDVHWYMIKKCFRKCDRLTSTQFVRFMYGLNQTRKIHESISTYELEYNLKRLIDQLSAEELAAVVLAFFKTATPVRDQELLFRVLKVVRDSMANMGSVEIAAVAKLARLSAQHNSEEHLLKFMEAYVPHVERLSATTCLHVVLLGTNQTKVVLPELAKLALKKFKNDMKSMRLKELERIALWMSMLNIPGNDALQMILNEINDPERENEINHYGKCLPALLHYLTFREIYDKRLISHVLSKEFQKKFFEKCDNMHRRETLNLDLTTQIELPEYSGNRLEDRKRKFLLKYLTFWISPENKTKIPLPQRVLSAVAETLEQSFGKKALMTSILPQYHCIEVVFCTDKQGRALAIPPYLRDAPQWEPKILPKAALLSPIVFHSFSVITRSVIIHNSKDVVGNVLIRERQLRKLGYQTHRITSDEWFDAPAHKRIEMLQSCITKGCQESVRSDEETVRETVVAS